MKDQKKCIKVYDFFDEATNELLWTDDCSETLSEADGKAYDVAESFNLSPDAIVVKERIVEL